MLPGLTTQADRLAPLSRLLSWGFALLMAAVLALGLGGCVGSGQPPQKVLLSALALQIDLTQRSIADALTLDAAGPPQVSRVRVESQENLPIGGGKGIHLSGRFDWRLAGDPIRVDSAFDLYLQRGERGQSWRLARPSGSEDGATQDWLTYPLPLKGEQS